MKNPAVPEIPVRFYRTSSGIGPVLEWLRDLPKEDRRVLGIDLMRVQVGWPIGMPLARSLGDGLWEMRSTLPSRRIETVAVLSRGRDRRAPRIHQEDTEDATG